MGLDHGHSISLNSKLHTGWRFIIHYSLQDFQNFMINLEAKNTVEIFKLRACMTSKNLIKRALLMLI